MNLIYKGCQRKYTYTHAYKLHTALLKFPKKPQRVTISFLNCSQNNINTDAQSSFHFGYKCL